MSAVGIDGSMTVTLGPKSGVPATACATGAGAPAFTGPAPAKAATATAAARRATLRRRERMRGSRMRQARTVRNMGTREMLRLEHNFRVPAPPLAKVNDSGAWGSLTDLPHQGGDVDPGPAFDVVIPLLGGQEGASREDC